MKKEIAVNYFKQGYNCAQSVVLAFADEVGLDEKTALKIASPFGGGMGRLREVCGAMSGMLIVYGLKYGYTSPDNNAVKMELYAQVQNLAGQFRAENGAIVCRELLSLPDGADSPVPEKRTTEYYKKRPCGEIVGAAAEILENYLKEKETK